MFNGMFPFNTKSNIGYTVALTYQFINSLSFLFTIVYVDSIGMMVINNVSLHVHILMENIKNLGMDRFGMELNQFQIEIDKKIDDIIIYHQMIIK